MALNDILFSEEFLFEGEQADKHKQDRQNAYYKAREERDKRIDNRYSKNRNEFPIGSKMNKHNPNYSKKSPNEVYKVMDKDQKIAKRARDMVDNHPQRNNMYMHQGLDAESSANRYLRRQEKKNKSKNESTIYGGLELI